MEQKSEFVTLASQEGANIKQLCRRFGISRTTGYALLRRFEAEGIAGLANRSKRPKSSPAKAPEALEHAIVAARQTHPAWGARKLKRWLENQGVAGLPTASTVHAILKRHGCIDAEEATKHQAFIRFEHERPNDLWQMDFKGHFGVGLGQARCHPLTVLDDHSRYVLCLAASDDERHETVQSHLIKTFRRYGLPLRMTMDNGSPWGDRTGHYTQLEIWLMRLGVKVSHSRPYHPQTQGKDERFHRTLKVELLQRRSFADTAEAQSVFDDWLGMYNRERPHEALQMMTPVTRYRPSPREYPETLPGWEYDERDKVRKVQSQGEVYFGGKRWKIGKGFIGEQVAFRADGEDGQYGVFLGTLRIGRLNLKSNKLMTGKWMN